MLEKKKVPVLVGFTEKSRKANAEKTKEKWERKGWTVVNHIDGGLTAASYLELEKGQEDGETVAKTTNNKTTKCKSCEKEISKTARTCPHCGQKNPNIGTAKGCLIVIFIAIFISILLIDDDGKTTATPEATKERAIEASKWYENGTLHQSNLKEWKQANYNDKLATSADFIFAANKSIKEAVLESGDLNNLKPFADSLVTCIDKGTEETEILDDHPVGDSAAICMVLMDFK